MASGGDRCAGKKPLAEERRRRLWAGLNKNNGAQQKQWRVARVVEQGRQSSGKQPEPQFALGPWIQAAKNGGGCLGMADVGGAFDIAAV